LVTFKKLQTYTYFVAFSFLKCPRNQNVRKLQIDAWIIFIFVVLSPSFVLLSISFDGLFSFIFEVELN